MTSVELFNKFLELNIYIKFAVAILFANVCGAYYVPVAPVVVPPPPAHVLAAAAAIVVAGAIPPVVAPLPVLVPTYVPVAGPLILYDQPVLYGVITNTLATNRKLQHERDLIWIFEEQLKKIDKSYNPNYQNNMLNIQNINSRESMNALKAYAKAIMYIYQSNAYVIKFHSNPFFPIQGIRASWLPIGWLDARSWVGDNLELNQLLREFNQLADIAMQKKPLTGQWMKYIILLYKYWRPVYAALFSIYIFKDIGKNEIRDTFLYSLLHGDIKKIIGLKFLGLKK